MKADDGRQEFDGQIDSGAQEAGGVPCRLLRLSKWMLAAALAQATI